MCSVPCLNLQAAAMASHRNAEVLQILLKFTFDDAVYLESNAMSNAQLSNWVCYLVHHSEKYLSLYLNLT